MIGNLVSFALGAIIASASIAVLYVRTKRHNASILTVIHGDLAGALARIEAKIDGGTIPK